MIVKFLKLITYLGLIDFLKGLTLTIKHFFGKKITVRYPEEHTPKSPRFRGLHALRSYPNGEERCIACKLCEATCPALAISIEATISEPKSVPRTTKYEIDLFKCIYCGMCEEACPVDAIVQTSIADYHFKHRGEQILTKEKLLAIGNKYELQIVASRGNNATSY